MELELCLDPEDAGRLPRLRCVSTAVRGRPRVQQQRLIWHDSPDQALAAAGLVLVQERSTWRLERLVPGDAMWPPGTPAPVVERAADYSAFEQALPVTLAPVASFEGRLASYVLDIEDSPVALGLLRGMLRGVADERPACRVLLAGSELPLRRLAVGIAEELPLAVPTACLATEGMALAQGLPPMARRQGPPLLPQGLTVAESFIWVLAHLTDVILHFGAAAVDPRAGPEAVHQMRVAVRRLRSCFSVFRPVVHCELVHAAEWDLKQLGKRLAPARDWDVFVTETAPAVLAALPENTRLRRLFRAADRRRQTCHAELRVFLESPAFRRLGIELAWLASADSWLAGLDTQGMLQGELRPFAGAALDRRLRKLLGSAEGINELSPTALHAIRLRAKRLRYGSEIFAPVYAPKLARRFIQRLSRLQQRLGELNDGTVVSTLMAELGGPRGRHGHAVGLVQGFAAARVAQGRDEALRAWDKFRRQQPFWD